MKMVGMVLFVGISGILTSTFAEPLDVTFDLGAPSHDWGISQVGNYSYQYADMAAINSESPPGILNLGGVNSIQVTWNAPAGYMFVVNPPPADIGPLTLKLETSYGWNSPSSAALVASLGSITSQSLSVHTIYGSSPFTGGVGLNSVNSQAYPPLNVEVLASITPNTQPFAFNSITISADFSGTGASGELDQSGGWDGFADLGAVLYGINNFSQYGIPYNGPGDPGQLFTLEPLPDDGGSVPDKSSTLSLAGVSFAGLLLLGRKMSPVNS